MDGGGVMDDEEVRLLVLLDVLRVAIVVLLLLIVLSLSPSCSVGVSIHSGGAARIRRSVFSGDTRGHCGTPPARRANGAG